FKKFSESLKQYEHTTAGTYDIHLKQEKAEADLRGYDSVIDYLLHKQKVDRELYDRQIDVITEELAPHMRRYAKLLQNVHGLDKMRYEDLIILLDPVIVQEFNVIEYCKYIL